MGRSYSAALATSVALGICAMLAVPPTAAAAGPVRVNGSGSALDLAKPLIAAYAVAHPAERFEMSRPLGSSGATLALLGGALDLAILSRPLAPEAVAQGASARVYGRTPLLIVTHHAVASTNITRAELEDIYSGRKTTWPDGQPIRIVLRPERETDTKILVGLSPGMARADAFARKQPWAIVAVTDPEANELVAKTPGAIGAATLTSVLVDRLPLNVLALDGVHGTVRELAAGRYAPAKDVIFVTTPRTPPAAVAFVEFAWSAEGRAIAERSGVLVTGAASAR
jgi:phosphate transport system substrate-binding protein